MVILLRGEEVDKISFSMGESTVFLSEVSAIIASAEYLLARNVTGCRIDILSDSQAGLKSIANPKCVSDTVRNFTTLTFI